MAIPFTQIPENLLVPGMYQENDNSLAGSTSEIKKALIVSYKTKTGSAPAGKPILVLSLSKAGEYCGYGSPASIAASSFLAINKKVELYILPVDEPEGTVWNKSFTVTVQNCGSGLLTVSVNGKEGCALVKTGSTAQQIAASLIASINGMANCPVEAEAGTENSGAFTVSALACGSWANDISIKISGSVSGVEITEGVAVTGSGTADLAAVFAAMGGERYHYFISDIFDETNAKAWDGELSARYSAMRQIGGRLFTAVSGELETMLTEAETVNSPHICLVSRCQNVQLPIEWAARFCASSTNILSDDPSANTYDTPVPGLITESEFHFDARQKLLERGIATWRLDTVGNVLIERLVTSYTENSDGERDTSYLDIQVTETVDAVRSYINSEAKKRYKTWKLAKTEENFGAGSKVMNVSVWRSFLADVYLRVFIQEKQWCQDFENYKDSIIVEIKTDSKTRLEYIHQPNLMGQFLIGSGLNQFK